MYKYKKSTCPSRVSALNNLRFYPLVETYKVLDILFLISILLFKS